MIKDLVKRVHTELNRMAIVYKKEDSAVIRKMYDVAVNAFIHQETDNEEYLLGFTEYWNHRKKQEDDREVWESDDVY